ncbi:MAG: hypothetical protein JNK07_06815 [Alphaproteobacteria bacterium]|nr:hypothetical protein [Alphaproteobacteria bacterium]
MIATFRHLLWIVAVLGGLAIPCSAQNNNPDEEAKRLAATSPFAKREDDRLILRMVTGATRTFVNAPACRDENPVVEARCVGYEFTAYNRAHRLFILNVYYYEGTDSLLVDDRTGRVTTFDGRIALSPSGDFVAETLAGLEGYDQAGPAIQIWRRGRIKFVREWRAAPGIANESEALYQVLKWPTEDRIEMQVAVDGEVSGFKLLRGPKGWHIAETER